MDAERRRSHIAFIVALRVDAAHKAKAAAAAAAAAAAEAEAKPRREVYERWDRKAAVRKMNKMTARKFRLRYRVSQATFDMIIDAIEDDLEPASRVKPGGCIGGPILAQLKLGATLRYLAGSNNIDCSDSHAIPETGCPESPHLGADPPSDPNTNNKNVAFAPSENLPIQSPAAALELGQMTPPEPTLGQHDGRGAPRDPRRDAGDARRARCDADFTTHTKNFKNLLENAPFAQQQNFIITALFHGKSARSTATGVNGWEHAGVEDMKTRDFHSLLTATSAGLVQAATLFGVTVGNFGKQTIQECFVEWSCIHLHPGRPDNSDPGAHHSIFAAAAVALFSNTYMKSAAISAAVIAGLEGGPLEFKSMRGRRQRHYEAHENRAHGTDQFQRGDPPADLGVPHREREVLNSAPRLLVFTDIAYFARSSLSNSGLEVSMIAMITIQIATLAHTWRKRNLDGMAAVDFNALVLKYQKDLASVIEKFVAPSRRAHESAFSAAAYRTGQIQNQNLERPEPARPEPEPLLERTDPEPEPVLERPAEPEPLPQTAPNLQARPEPEPLLERTDPEPEPVLERPAEPEPLQQTAPNLQARSEPEDAVSRMQKSSAKASGASKLCPTLRKEDGTSDTAKWETYLAERRDFSQAGPRRRDLKRAADGEVVAVGSGGDFFSNASCALETRSQTLLIWTCRPPIPNSNPHPLASSPRSIQSHPSTNPARACQTLNPVPPSPS
ncbi:hypothetical protein T492DRAFT_1144753 [Pavlovales sp. CCMP2436]|nr:hypothetical protein T492DRAFT_1144753 [Pavlovales sp. CCMP2436]